MKVFLIILSLLIILFVCAAPVSAKSRVASGVWHVWSVREEEGEICVWEVPTYHFCLDLAADVRINIPDKIGSASFEDLSPGQLVTFNQVDGMITKISVVRNSPCGNP